MYYGKYEQLQDEAWLREQYVDKVRSATDIAKEVGCHRSSVYTALKRHNIERRIRTSKYPLLNNKEWLRQVYLEEKKSLNEIAELVGSTVGNIHAALKTLGIETRDYKEGFRTKFPDGRWGEDHPRWRGGRVEMAKPDPAYKERLGERGPRHHSGYIYIYKPDHPRATQVGYVMEHRLVAEKHLGRYLRPDEIVHHKDGDRSNNAWENLEVATRSKHVSNHFANGYELQYWKERAKQLEAENARLKVELEGLRNGADDDYSIPR